MPILSTPQHVIQAFGVASLPDYCDIEPFVDGSAAFSTKRRYAPDLPVAHVVTGRGEPYAACTLRLIVAAPTAHTGVSRVHGEALLHERCQERHRWEDHNFSDPACPTEATFFPFKNTRKPREVALAPEVFYDCNEDRFYGPQGEVTGQQILDDLYLAHCGTLGVAARVKRSASRARRKLIHQVVWKGQDIALWLLRNGYDISPKEYKGSPFGKPFRIYKWDDFVRSSDENSSHFFGFESSKRSLFSNLGVLIILLAGTYWLLPHSGFLLAVYRNTVLSTVAVVFAFLAADQLCPLFLRGVVWTLSRFRVKTLGF